MDSAASANTTLLFIPLPPAKPDPYLSFEAQTLPVTSQRRPTSTRSRLTWTRWLICGLLVAFWVWSSQRTWKKTRAVVEPFFYNISEPGELCPAVAGPGVSHAGYIGLKGDSEETPKKSFFWLFEAEYDAGNAPLILTIGGGPGTTGLSNPMAVQGPCRIVDGPPEPNPNRWTEHFNLLALDHPIGAGFSFGSMVNNSRDAAIDVYDFLQKFYIVFPQFSGNPLVISGGSYGGTYVPHIATVIHEQNLLVTKHKGQPGAIPIHLESLMVSNPISDAASHFRWKLYERCTLFTNMYNATTCAELAPVVPQCLDAIAFAQQTEEWIPERHNAAYQTCTRLESGDTHGTVVEDTRKKACSAFSSRFCYSKDPMGCLPPSIFTMEEYFRRPDVKDTLGVPQHLNLSFFSEAVNQEFEKYGDLVQSAYLLYTPLLEAGIRLLHYVGAQDANCAWPGVLSYVKLIQSPFQEQFLSLPDLPWPTATSNTTARVVGPGAGNFTWILIDGGGHFIARDQPVLAKKIVETWIHNEPFFDEE
ncbi:SET domain-containing protein [Mycena chlorophos]|uniref:carboxypeptidase C n=1 Tax=Mycena chlorophos TaxID=658473 RepID=A0A8H6SFC6_MYCCL|nr:SET domain-containing protein [Mycena chlorophos]